MGSPLPPCTPRNNVLKKVASFTAEKAAAGSASKINNGDSNSGIAGPFESNGLRRSSFVPEKLSFAAYEKFEGKWRMYVLQLLDLQDYQYPDSTATATTDSRKVNLSC